MKCSKHQATNCRECFQQEVDTRKRIAFEPCAVDSVSLIVNVVIDKREVDKLNRRATEAGRAPRTAEEIVENLVVGSLRHQWVCQEVKTTIMNMNDAWISSPSRLGEVSLGEHLLDILREDVNDPRKAAIIQWLEENVFK